MPATASRFLHKHPDHATLLVGLGVPLHADGEPVVAFVARSSASEWDEIIPYDRTKDNC